MTIYKIVATSQETVQQSLSRAGFNQMQRDILMDVQTSISQVLRIESNSAPSREVLDATDNHVHKRIRIISHNDSVGSTIVATCDGPEPLLTSGIPLHPPRRHQSEDDQQQRKYI